MRRRRLALPFAAFLRTIISSPDSCPVRFCGLHGAFLFAASAISHYSDSRSRWHGLFALSQRDVANVLDIEPPFSLKRTDPAPARDLGGASPDLEHVGHA